MDLHVAGMPVSRRRGAPGGVPSVWCKLFGDVLVCKSRRRANVLTWGSRGLRCCLSEVRVLAAACGRPPHVTQPPPIQPPNRQPLPPSPRLLRTGTGRYKLMAAELAATPDIVPHISRYLPSVRCTGAAFSFVVDLIIPGNPVLHLVMVREGRPLRCVVASRTSLRWCGQQNTPEGNYTLEDASPPGCPIQSCCAPLHGCQLAEHTPIFACNHRAVCT